MQHDKQPVIMNSQTSSRFNLNYSNFTNITAPVGTVHSMLLLFGINCTMKCTIMKSTNHSRVSFTGILYSI